jgi:hypothetical protein
VGGYVGHARGLALRRLNGESQALSVLRSSTLFAWLASCLFVTAAWWALLAYELFRLIELAL